MYQLEVKAVLVAQRFPASEGWSTIVDVDGMERGRGGNHPTDKLARVDIAYKRLEKLGSTLTGKHPKYQRVDIIAEHPSHGIVIVEVEGNASRQKEQAMYAALGQLIISMRFDSVAVSYAIAVPDDPEWRRQLEKIPLSVLAKLKIQIFFVDANKVSEYPDADDVTDRCLLGDETADVLPAGAVDDLAEFLGTIKRDQQAR